MNSRFQDSASAYRLHRSITDESEAIAAAIGRFVGSRFELTRSRLRLLDAGTGDGRVLKAVLESLLEKHRGRPCEVALKEYDFHHIEALLQNVAPMLTSWPRLTLFVTNRTFRKLQGLVEDLSPENTVSFDDIAGYRMLAMTGASSVMNQQDATLHSTPRIGSDRIPAAMTSSWIPVSDERDGDRSLRHFDPAAIAAPALKALGDEIRAREIYDELEAVGVEGKHFTVTVARQDDVLVGYLRPRDFFWDLAVVSHAFNRDKKPDWICRNILLPLCAGLSTGGVLVNVHAIDGGRVSEIRSELFGDEFSFRDTAATLAGELASTLDQDEFELLPPRQFSYRSRVDAVSLRALEPWARESVLQQLAVSVAYHLQVPEESWLPRMDAIAEMIERGLETDGMLDYCLSIAGVRRRN